MSSLSGDLGGCSAVRKWKMTLEPWGTFAFILVFVVGFKAPTPFLETSFPSSGFLVTSQGSLVYLLVALGWFPSGEEGQVGDPELIFLRLLSFHLFFLFKESPRFRVDVWMPPGERRPLALMKGRPRCGLHPGCPGRGPWPVPGAVEQPSRPATAPTCCGDPPATSQPSACVSNSAEARCTECLLAKWLIRSH